MMFRRIVVAAERIAYRASGSWSFLDRSDFCGREDLARINGQRFCVVASSRKTFPYNGIIRTDDDVHYLALVLRVSERAVPVLLNLSAAGYMMIGSAGWHTQFNPEMLARITVGESLAIGAGVFVLVNGILFFGDLRDRLRMAREMVSRKRREMFGGR